MLDRIRKEETNYAAEKSLKEKSGVSIILHSCHISVFWHSSVTSDSHA
jgi:hypothetical protein